jgi:tetratricopeptide (TPR) repeat protein
LIEVLDGGYFSSPSSVITASIVLFIETWPGLIIADKLEYLEDVEAGINDDFAIEPDVLRSIMNVLKKLHNVSVKDWIVLGHEFKYCFEFESAIDCMNKAISIDPSDPHAYIAMGDIYSFMTEFENAYDYYSKALALDPSNQDAQELTQYSLDSIEMQSSKNNNDS